MGWGAIFAALRLGGGWLFDGLVRGLSPAIKWVFSDWRHPLLVLCAAMWAVHALVIRPQLRADLAATAGQLEQTQLAHLGTIYNFIDAGDEARRQAEANVARVTAEQKDITDATLVDLRSDLAAVTARFDRLRARSAAADPGRADPAGLPGASSASGGAAGAPGDPDLRAARELSAQPLCPSSLVCLTIDEAERASEDARRQNALIDWVIAQSAIRFTTEEIAE